MEHISITFEDSDSHTVTVRFSNEPRNDRVQSGTVTARFGKSLFEGDLGISEEPHCPIGESDIKLDHGGNRRD